MVIYLSLTFAIIIPTHVELYFESLRTQDGVEVVWIEMF